MRLCYHTDQEAEYRQPLDPVGEGASNTARHAYSGLLLAEFYWLVLRANVDVAHDPLSEIPCASQRSVSQPDVYCCSFPVVFRFS